MSLRLNILASWVAHIVMVAIGFIMVPFVRNTLAPGAYGVWVFVNTLSGYTGLLYMGFGATVCRYVSKHVAKEEWNELNNVSSTIFAVYSGMACVVLLLAGGLCAAAPWVDLWGGQPISEVQAVILINGLSTAIGMIGSVFGGILIGTQRVGLNRSIEVGSGLLRFGLAIGCLKLRPELTTLSLLFCGVTIVENLLLVVCARRLVPRLQLRRDHVSRETLRECFAFSGYNAIGQVAEQLIYLTDTVVIGCALGSQHVEPYYIALRIGQMIQVPIARIGEVVLPKAGQLHSLGKHAELAQIIERMVALTFVLVAGFFIGSVYFGGMLIRSWVGTGLDQSHRILLILLAAQIVAQPMIVLRKAMLGMGIARVPALIDIAEAIINLALSLTLVFRWGIEGVAWGTFLPLVFVELLVFLPYACRQVAVRKRDLLQRSILPCLAPLAALWVFCEFANHQDYPDGWLTLLGVAAAGGVVLLASGYPIVRMMSRTERTPSAPPTVGRAHLPVPSPNSQS